MRLRRLTYAGIVAFGLCVLAQSAATAQVPLIAVAETGRPAAGTEPGTVFDRVNGAPLINASGEVVFLSSLAGPGVTAANDQALWTYAGGNPQVAVRSGDPAPGAPAGTTFSAFGWPNLGRGGEVAFLGLLSNRNRGIWAGPPSSLSLVAQNGAIAPGTPAGKTLSFVSFETAQNYVPLINGRGNVAFRGFAGDPGNVFSLKSGIWTNAPGPLTQVARAGNPPPGDPAGPPVDAVNLAPAFNDAGTIGFNASGPYLGGATSPAPLIVPGQTSAPGVPGATFTGGSVGGLNAAGDVAFVGLLTGAGIDDANNIGVWAGQPGAMRLVARMGDPAPGTAGLTFQSFQRFSINHNGQVALGSLVANSSGATREALFVGDHESTLALVAMAGDHAPGTPDGVTFDFFNYGFTINPAAMALNGNGAVVFTGDVAGPGVTNATNGGIWASDGATVRLVAREGDVMNVAGALRTVDFLTVYTGSGGEDGLPTSLNDAGQLTFAAHFTDGSDAVFVTTVPEPGAAMIVALAGLGLLRRRSGTRARVGKEY